MSRRKNPDTFASNPFKALKGFDASPAPQKPITPPVAKSAVADDPDFAVVMAASGVIPLAPAAENQPDPGPAAPPPSSVAEADPDEQLFLAAFSGMQTVFRDEIREDDDEPSLPRIASRRMKLLRQGRVPPEATLDLHGLTREAARSRVGFFLDNAGHHGLSVVLIITGWGKSGSGASVLREDLVAYLRSAAALVSEWTMAPRSLGGEGAIVVFLRSRKGR